MGIAEQRLGYKFRTHQLNVLRIIIKENNSLILGALPILENHSVY